MRLLPASPARRRVAFWAACLLTGLIPWVVVADPDSTYQFLVAGLFLLVAMGVALVVIGALVAARAPGWLLVVLLWPVLGLSLAALAHASVALEAGPEDAAVFLVLNSWGAFFSGCWTFFSLLAGAIFFLCARLLRIERVPRVRSGKRLADRWRADPAVWDPDWSMGRTGDPGVDDLEDDWSWPPRGR